MATLEKSPKLGEKKFYTVQFLDAKNFLKIYDFDDRG